MNIMNAITSIPSQIYTRKDKLPLWTETPQSHRIDALDLFRPSKRQGIDHCKHLEHLDLAKNVIIRRREGSIYPKIVGYMTIADELPLWAVSDELPLWTESDELPLWEEPRQSRRLFVNNLFPPSQCDAEDNAECLDLAKDIIIRNRDYSIYTKIIGCMIIAASSIRLMELTVTVIKGGAVLNPTTAVFIAAICVAGMIMGRDVITVGENLFKRNTVDEKLFKRNTILETLSTKISNFLDHTLPFIGGEDTRNFRDCYLPSYLISRATSLKIMAGE